MVEPPTIYSDFYNRLAVASAGNIERLGNGGKVWNAHTSIGHVGAKIPEYGDPWVVFNSEQNKIYDRHVHFLLWGTRSNKPPQIITSEKRIYSPNWEDYKDTSYDNKFIVNVLNQLRCRELIQNPQNHINALAHGDFQYLIELTHNCTGGCRICINNSTIKDTKYLSKETVFYILEQISKISSWSFNKSVILSGGDPFDADRLAGGDYLFPIIQKALELGVKVHLKSHFNWALDLKSDYFKKLRELTGPREKRILLHFSIDDHHNNCIETTTNIIKHFYENPMENLGYRGLPLLGSEINMNTLIQNLKDNGIKITREEVNNWLGDSYGGWIQLETGVRL